MSSVHLRHAQIWVQESASRPIRQKLPPAEAAEFWRGKGNDFFKFGDLARAKECYTTSIEEQPSAAAYANRALMCVKAKEWQQAEADCSLVRLLQRERHVSAAVVDLSDVVCASAGEALIDPCVAPVSACRGVHDSPQRLPEHQNTSMRRARSAILGCCSVHHL